MSSGLTGLQVACLVVALVAVAGLVAVDRTRWGKQAPRDLTSKLPIVLTASAQDRLARRALRDARMLMIASGGAAGVMFVSSSWSAAVAGLQVFWAVQLLVGVAQLLAPFHQAAELVLQPPRAVPAGPRVARSRRVALSDVVRPFDLVVVRLTSACAVLLMATAAVGSWTYGARRSQVLTAVAAGALIFLATVMVEVCARLAVSRSRPAGSDHGLMSEDVLVANSARAAYLAVSGIAWFGSMTLFMGLEGGLPLPEVAIVLYATTSVGWLVTSISLPSRESVRHVLVRLWDLPRRTTPPPVYVPTIPGNPYRGGPR